MSIKIFHIPFSSKGSTDNLFRIVTAKIKGPDYSKILYIAPTPRKIRDSQQIFHTFTEGFYIPPGMMTIKQLSKQLYALYGDKKVIPQSLIPVILSELTSKGIGFSSIISNFIHEIKQYHPKKPLETISLELNAIFNELGIPEEVTQRARETLSTFNTYQGVLNMNSALDENDIMAACPDLIRIHKHHYSILILDGFYEITKSEEAIVKSLIENAGEVLISIPSNANLSYISNYYISFLNNNFIFENIHVPPEKGAIEPRYHTYPGIEEEIEGIARDIKNLFLSGKIKDLDSVIVTFPDLYKYTDRISRIFKKYGIPYTISISKPFGKSGPFLDLIALLDSLSDDYPRLPFSQFLVSPYFKNLPAAFRDFIPRICLMSGIIKGKDSWLNLPKTVFPDGIEKDIRWIFKKLAPLESVRQRGSFSLFSELIVKLLDNLDFSDVGNQNIDYKEHASEILKALSFLDTLIHESVPLTLRQFTDAFKHILNLTQTQIEDTGVQIMGFLEIQGIEPEYLYFGGLKDGDLPSKPDIDHILPDSIRTRFGLVNLNKYLLLQRFVYERAIGSAKNVHLSYHAMDGERFFLPSPYLPWNREELQGIYGIFSKEEELIRKGRIFLTSNIIEIEGIQEKTVKNKFGEKTYIRVTDIDSYRTCPRKFFIEKILHLEPVDIKKYEVEAVLLGTIIHEIMQSLISMPFRDLDDLIVRAEEIIGKLLSVKPVEEYWKKVIKDTFLSILPDIYKIEQKIMDEGYSFMKAEVPVEGEIIKGIKLKGKIDRIDKKTVSIMQQAGSRKEKITDAITRTGDIIEIIDYKTGATQFSGPQVMSKGAALQLFLYAALMKARGAEAERVGIYSLKDLSISWIPGKNDRKDGRTIDDYIISSLKYLVETVKRMRSGDFSANPLNEQTCRNCPERPYCPYIQKTYGKVS